jgi:hypothetical protein
MECVQIMNPACDGDEVIPDGTLSCHPLHWLLSLSHVCAEQIGEDEGK